MHTLISIYCTPAKVRRAQLCQETPKSLLLFNLLRTREHIFIKLMVTLSMINLDIFRFFGWRGDLFEH